MADTLQFHKSVRGNYDINLYFLIITNRMRDARTFTDM